MRGEEAAREAVEATPRSGEKSKKKKRAGRRSSSKRKGSTARRGKMDRENLRRAAAAAAGWGGGGREPLWRLLSSCTAVCRQVARERRTAFAAAFPKPPADLVLAGGISRFFFLCVFLGGWCCC